MRRKCEVNPYPEAERGGGETSMIVHAIGTSRVLLDTNVLVFAYDRAEVGKQRRARSVLQAVALPGTGAAPAPRSPVGRIRADYGSGARGGAGGT